MHKFNKKSKITRLVFFPPPKFTKFNSLRTQNPLSVHKQLQALGIL